MGVCLRPVREDELPDWLADTRRQYKDDIAANAGMPREAAERKAERDFSSLCLEGRPGEGHSLFVLEDEASGERVGRAWLADREGPQGKDAYVYDVFVAERERGRGFGRRAMELLEDEARRRGYARIRLNVFGGNVVARSLYRSLGYRELGVFIGKDLT